MLHRRGVRRWNIQQRWLGYLQPVLPRDLPLRHLRRCDSDCSWRECHLTRRSMRDSHLLGWWLQQRLSHAILSILSRSIVLRELRTIVLSHAIQRFANCPRIPRRCRQRRKLRRSSRRQPELDLWHFGLVAYLWERHHPHQRATCQCWEGLRGLHQPNALRQSYHHERHYIRWEPRMWHCWLHGCPGLGPGDGAGYA